MKPCWHIAKFLCRPRPIQTGRNIINCHSHDFTDTTKFDVARATFNDLGYGMTRVNDYTAMKVKVPSMLLPFCILVSRATIDTAPSVPTWIMDAPGDSYIAAVTILAGLYPIGSVPARTDVQVLISAVTPTPVTCTTTTRPHASAQIEPYATAIGESCTLTRDTECYSTTKQTEPLK